MSEHQASASGADSLNGGIKQHITASDVSAYLRAKELKMDQPVMFGELRCKASGMLGVALVFKVKGKLTKVYVGDPRLLDLKPLD